MLSKLWAGYEATLMFGVANAFFALSMYVTMWVGVFSFASVTFGAVSAFISTYLYASVGIPLLLCFAIGVLAATMSAALIALPLRRLESHWLALATVAIVLVTRVVVLNTPRFTGGSTGVPVLGSIGWPLLISLLVATAWVLSKLRRSRFGYAANAVNTDPVVASALGVNVSKIQGIGFLLSGCIGGVGGVVMASLLGYISADTFYVTLAFYAVAAVVLGGVNHWSGPILGAFLFALLPQLLGGLFGQGQDIANGVLLLAIIVFFPNGLVDPSRKLSISALRASVRRVYGNEYR